MHLRPTLIFVLVTVASVSGCVADDNPGFFIKHNASPDTQCMWNESSPALGSGMLDIGYENARYSVFPVYNSQLRSRYTANPSRVDTNKIQITSANITLTDASGTPLPIPQPSFSVTTSGLVDTALDSTIGVGLGQIQIIPSIAANEIRALGLVAPPTATTAGTYFDMVAHVTVLGRTIGGVDIETGEWDWPITLCDGCLQCAGEPPDVACHPGQDGEGYFAGCPASM